MRDPFNWKRALDEGREVKNFGNDLAYEEGVSETEHDLRLANNPASRSRVIIFRLAVLLSMLLVGVRLYYLTVVRHDYFQNIADGNRLRIEYLPAPRGTIYDFYGEIIAGNRPSFELVASPIDLPAGAETKKNEIAEVATILKEPAETIEAKLTLPAGAAIYESVLVKQNLNREQALTLEERLKNLSGFRLINSPIRDYVSPLSFAHLAGYVGKLGPEEYRELSSSGYLFNDSLGKTGLEQTYERDLRGKFGQRQVEVDAAGVVKKIFGEKSATAGADLVLNIDAKLQQKLYDSLTAELNNIGRRRAAAIAMDPQSGRILAYLSLPSFDNNLFAEGISQYDYQKLVSDKNQPLFNRAIRGTYPPGSTVKPLVAVAALAEGVVTENTKITDTGYILVPNVYGGPDYYFYGYNRAGLGVMDVRSAIAMSSDIYFYSVGGGNEKIGIKGLGIDRLTEYYRKFNSDQKLGIDLPGEAAGLVPTPEWKKDQWYLGDTYHVAIGQGDLLVTPLHVLSWISTIANGGKIYRPFLVNRIQNKETGVIKQFEPTVEKTLEIDPRYLQIARAGMRQTVTDGTAKSLQNVPMAVAGKTGTAQFFTQGRMATHAWFVGYAPYDNPRIAIVVLIEDGGEGSATAVPVVRDVLTWWAKNRFDKF